MAKGKAKGGGAVGQALIKRNIHRLTPQGGRSTAAHNQIRNNTWETDGAPRAAPLASVVEQSDLQDFLATAELAGREFSANRGEAQILFTGPGYARGGGPPRPPPSPPLPVFVSSSDSEYQQLAGGFGFRRGMMGCKVQRLGSCW